MLKVNLLYAALLKIRYFLRRPFCPEIKEPNKKSMEKKWRIQGKSFFNFFWLFLA
jgi:hypothetical protein